MKKASSKKEDAFVYFILKWSSGHDKMKIRAYTYDNAYKIAQFKLYTK